MSFTDYRIEGELRLVQDDVVLVSSFSRDHLMFYVGMREAGLTHADAASRLMERYGGPCGGPRPRVYYADETELYRVDNDYSRLTSTEAEIAALVPLGLSNSEIGRKVYKSDGTIKSHLTNMFVRLGVHNRVQLAVLLVNHPELLEPGRADD